MNKLTLIRFAAGGFAALTLGTAFLTNSGTSYADDADSAGYFQMRVAAAAEPAEGGLSYGKVDCTYTGESALPANVDDFAAEQDSQAIRGRVTGWFETPVNGQTGR